MLELAAAPFSKEDAALVPGAGSWSIAPSAQGITNFFSATILENTVTNARTRNVGR
jgi:hypothetical protein